MLWLDRILLILLSLFLWLCIISKGKKNKKTFYINSNGNRNSSLNKWNSNSNSSSSSCCCYCARNGSCNCNWKCKWKKWKLSYRWNWKNREWKLTRKNFVVKLKGLKKCIRLNNLDFELEDQYGMSIELLKKNENRIKENLKKRGADECLSIVDLLKTLIHKKGQLERTNNSLRNKKKILSDQVKTFMSFFHEGQKKKQNTYKAVQINSGTVTGTNKRTIMNVRTDKDVGSNVKVDMHEQGQKQKREHGEEQGQGKTHVKELDKIDIHEMDPEQMIKYIKELKKQIYKMDEDMCSNETKLTHLQSEIEQHLRKIPNMLLKTVPDATKNEKNKIVKTYKCKTKVEAIEKGKEKEKEKEKEKTEREKDIEKDVEENIENNVEKNIEKDIKNDVEENIEKDVKIKVKVKSKTESSLCEMKKEPDVVIPHDEIIKRYGKDSFLTDISNKIGFGYNILINEVAKLERALIEFMIETHTKKFDYFFVKAPVIVPKSALLNSGQLPKFEKELFQICKTNYKILNEDAYLIPTSEVSLLNLFRNSLIDYKQLPIKLISYSSCFRNEKNVCHGKSSKGLLREYIFEKVELITITDKKNSISCYHNLISHCEYILKKLNIPYRLVLLNSCDTPFSASICYDIEAWLPSQRKFIEVSSCSNCLDFQSRKLNLKFKKKKKQEMEMEKEKEIKREKKTEMETETEIETETETESSIHLKNICKPKPDKLKLDKSEKFFCHTINGSGLAVGRILAIILEQYQVRTGSTINDSKKNSKNNSKKIEIKVPKPLHKFMKTSKIIL